jgi:hypothetical protein
MRLYLGVFLWIKYWGIASVLAQSYHDIVVTEIMADPTPTVGLPAAEFLEIYNRTSHPISLIGWKLTIDSRTVFLPSFQIDPEEYVLLCHQDNQVGLSAFGKVVGLTAFNLPNTASRISIYNASNQVVHTVHYRIANWSTSKNDGGYTLEMKDVLQPCIEDANWATSLDPEGGTPGRRNSVSEAVVEINALEIEHLRLRASHSEVVIRFNRGMDSLNMIQAFLEMRGNDIVSKRLTAPEFRELVLQLRTPLNSLQPIYFEMSSATDCSGQPMQPIQLSFGLPTESQPGDVVINEILFNPKPDGVDFVEIYNSSNRFISLKNWELANSKNEMIDVRRVITTDDVLLPPQGFMALTTYSNSLRQQYVTNQYRNMLEMGSLPAYSNAEGGVALINDQGRVQDQFSYSEKMHSYAVNSYKGISLERLNPNVRADDVQNWTSAAALSGFATPGYKNSQYTHEGLENDFVLQPEAFSPNGDGYDDVTLLRFEQKHSGRIASISIFNMHGTRVHQWIDQQMIGTNGQIVWDGLDQYAQRVPPGHYVLLIEVFDHMGYQIQIPKKVVVLY